MWLKTVNYFVFDILKLASGSFAGDVLSFIIYDFFKILTLVFLIMTLVGYIRTYLDSEKLSGLMHKKMFGLNYLAASTLGAVTPFCSCSGIPIFIGLIKSGIPLGVAIAFLVTSPIVNEVVLVLMGNYYGWHIAAIYGISGILLGVISGIVISALKMDDQIILKKKTVCCSDGSCEEESVENPVYNNQKDRLIFAVTETSELLKSITKFIFLGVFIGGFIHNLIPSDVIQTYTGGNSLLSVPIAVFIGVPIYAGCSTIAPAIFSITAQGVPLGTSLALLMSVAGLSLPEAMILKSTMSLKLLAIFFGIVSIGIIFTGYLFNYIML